jgi:hypothetical protein
MGFYKRDNETLLQAPNFVHAPNYSLTAENHAEHTYPVDGWYWFDTLDEAMVEFITQPDVPTVTALQGMLAIQQAGLVAGFNAWKASLDPVEDFATIAFFEKAQTWRRNNPYLIQGATALGLNDEQLNQLFVLAATL